MDCKPQQRLQEERKQAIHESRAASLRQREIDGLVDLFRFLAYLRDNEDGDEDSDYESF
jgi:hypothetical protein